MTCGRRKQAMENLSRSAGFDLVGAPGLHSDLPWSSPFGQALASACENAIVAFL